ncbi:MAG: DUF2786 domain-containing protein [Alphaproteobacteria bacterium]|nr:DUF2786 domain-containing protein [Alphaproteobacteria bacterium]
MRVADDLLIDAMGKQWRDLRFQHDLRLQPPGFAIHAGRSRLGLWMRGQRTISMSREHCLQDPWLDVVETLRHEVAHQVVDEVHGGGDTPHGPLFQRVLAELGALPVASGEEPPVVGRVRKLLALAQSPNRHEAELAMAKAQKLMIRNRIDSARVDGARGFVRRQLGEPRRRQARWRSSLASTVATHFFVEVVRSSVFLPAEADWGSVWEIAGRPEDVDLCTYAYTFVERTAERLWEAHLAAHPRASRSRDRFLMGVVLGFRAKLEATADEARREGLVLVGDPALDAAWSTRHPKLVQSRGSYRVDAHFHAGQAAGSGVVLHRPVTGRSGGGGLLKG